jgi:hypothetical protein
MKKTTFSFFFLIINFLILQAQSPIKNCSIDISNDSISNDSSGTAKSTSYCRTCNLWANGRVPFEFDANVSSENRQRTLAVMTMLENIAHIDFFPRTNQSQFIRFVDSDVNSSFVGMQSHGNTIKLFNWNIPMIICHEIFHSLGFFHEHQRPDRDTYVQIRRDDICPDAFDANFPIEPNTAVTSNIPYDFESIMHYDSTAFSRCVNPSSSCRNNNPCPPGTGNTVIAQPRFAEFQHKIGQRNYLSRADSLMLRFLYPFPKDRFVNIQHPPFPIPTDGLDLRTAYPNFDRAYVNSILVRSHAVIWMMPGDYSDAEGIYRKPCTLRSPFGSVILR